MSGFMFFALILIHLALANGIYLPKNESKIVSKVSPADWTEPDEDGLWSTLLEEWTLNQNSNTRNGRVIHPSSHRYIPTSGFYITKRMGAAMELEPHMRKPTLGKVISDNPPNHPNRVNHPQNFTPMRQNYVGGNGGDVMSSPREVSETDLYLLGAIEKLVYRVDYMEGRLRRAEQIIYYLMAGNTQKPDPCPENFTRAGENCYYFGSERGLNWKSANTMCKSRGGYLAEFETTSEFQEVVAFILNNPTNRGKDFWLGGLNPGLLWIWTHSARPINPNTNLTSVSATTTVPPVDLKDSTKIVNKKENASSSTSPKENIEISGTGRCLRLSYNPSLYTYGYSGQECSSRYNYLCEIETKTLDNEISRISKELILKSMEH